MDIGPVEFPQLTFNHAIQAGQLISRQPAATGGQDVEERRQRSLHDGNVPPGTRTTDHQVLPRLPDLRSQRRPRCFCQRPQTRLILKCWEPELTLACRHGRILAARPD